jgi:hypothetical protein
MAEKRIRNATTKKYYKIRERNTQYGDKGEIKGLWKAKDGTPKEFFPPRDEEGRFIKYKN